MNLIRNIYLFINKSCQTLVILVFMIPLIPIGTFIESLVEDGFKHYFKSLIKTYQWEIRLLLEKVWEIPERKISEIKWLNS